MSYICHTTDDDDGGANSFFSYSFFVYLQSQNYCQADDLDPETVKELARLLARVHSLDVPISKDGYDIFSEVFIGDFDKKIERPEFRNIVEKEYLRALAKEQDLKLREKYCKFMKFA